MSRSVDRTGGGGRVSRSIGERASQALSVKRWTDKRKRDLRHWWMF